MFSTLNASLLYLTLIAGIFQCGTVFPLLITCGYIVCGRLTNFLSCRLLIFSNKEKLGVNLNQYSVTTATGNRVVAPPVDHYLHRYITMVTAALSSRRETVTTCQWMSASTRTFLQYTLTWKPPNVTPLVSVNKHMCGVHCKVKGQRGLTFVRMDLIGWIGGMKLVSKLEAGNDRDGCQIRRWCLVFMLHLKSMASISDL